MNWESNEIQTLLCMERTLRQGQITVLKFDQGRQVGVGHVSHDGLVLLLPSQKGVSGFNDRHLTFMPEVDLETENSSEIRDVALLQCAFGDSAGDAIPAVSSVFSALIKQAIHSDDKSAAGKTVHALRRLFDNRMRADVSKETEVGLLGELLLIASSRNPELLVESWHTANSDPYDFSLDSERVEVKATTSGARQHSFSSTQLPPQDGVSVVVSSICLVAVAKGETVASMYRKVLNLLPDERLQERFTTVCLDVLGVPAEVIESTHIDEMSSRANIKHFDSSDVPSPILVSGVQNCRWTALLSESTLGSNSRLL
jgi:hypothetical protein